MFNKIRKKYILLAVIVLLAGFLRFWHLGSNPPSLDPDEAAWGYNAYSLGIDGKDEYGRFLPYNYLESFGDYKPPMYAYLDILPVKIFGLNEFSARFPSAFFGTLTVLITFFLVRRLFKSSKDDKKKEEEIFNIALISSLILALSPWHIMLSRAAFEANVSTFYIVTGIWLFLYGVQEKKWYLLLSAVSFALSFYTFNTARVFVPLILLFLFIACFRTLMKIKLQTFLGIALLVLMILPIVKFLLSPQARLRYQQVNIFSDISIINTSNQEMTNDHNVFWTRIIHNRRLLYATDFISHYFDNLEPSFLFIKGDSNPKFSIQTVGEMYIWDIPFFLLGVLFLFKRKQGLWWIIPAWIGFGIVPAATSLPTPHALRIETVVPAFQILSAYGFFMFLTFVRKYKYKMIIQYGLGVLLFINFLYFWNNLMTYYPFAYSGQWNYGYKQSIEYVKKVQNQFTQIDITQQLGSPYIYYLFYLKYPPSLYRKTAEISRDVFGVVNVEGFSKYRFAENLNTINNIGKKVLYIVPFGGVPIGAHVLKTFYLLNGQPALIAYEL